MGLGNFTPDKETTSKSRFKSYGYHPMNDTLQKWIDELQCRFPEEVRVDFVEVSPEMTRTDGYAYWKKRDGQHYQYIRIAEKAIEKYSDNHLKRILIHEMCHCYCFQKGYPDVSDSNRVFSWILGRVKADISGYSQSCGEWEDLVEPFL